MKVTIDIAAGNNQFGLVTKTDVEKNIQAVQRAIDGKSQAQDSILLLDTKWILIGIQEQLPKGG